MSNLSSSSALEYPVEVMEGCYFRPNRQTEQCFSIGIVWDPRSPLLERKRCCHDTARKKSEEEVNESGKYDRKLTCLGPGEES